MSRRKGQRIPIRLDAKFVSAHASYLGSIENISDHGLYAKITCMEHFTPGTTAHIQFHVPNGQCLDLECKRVWSRKDVSNHLTEHIGMEIIDPPQEYSYFYDKVKSGKVNFFNHNQFTGPI